MEMDYGAASEETPSQVNKPFLEADCNHVLLIENSKPQEGFKGRRYIVEVKVLKSEPTHAKATPAPVGAERVVIINLDNKKYGNKNLMAYAYGVNGGPPNGATKEEKGQKLAKLLGVAEDKARGIAFQEAFAIGLIVGNKTVAGEVGRKDNVPGTGTPFTYHNWYTVKQTRDQRDERYALIKARQSDKVTLAADNIAA